MWCCFKPPDTKIEIPKWLPEAPDGCLEDPPTPLEKIPERFDCLERLEDPPTPITAPDSTEVVIDIVEPFVLEHSTISMEPCEITEN
jgi:hypothetical protein